MATVEEPIRFSLDTCSPPTTLSVSESPHSEAPGNGNGPKPGPKPIAICGVGLRLPGGIRNCDDYWSLLINGRDARGPIPASRYNAFGFDGSLGGKNGFTIEQGYFLEEDLAALDTAVFRLTKSELERTDPQQRMLLEVTRECLDDAGEVGDRYRGKAVGCYVGTFGDDWLLVTARDTAGPGGGSSVTGAGDLMLANRMSFEYDFRGPSMAVKTGCSASMVALHEACRAVQAGDACAAVVAGTSMILTPMLTATMAANELLSPDASCKTFDAAANGFARAEAVSAIYIKPLEDALRDGNPVRAVIRATAVNTDGKGVSLVTPNGDAQAALIRHAYRSAGLDPSDTAFVECHGTGTPTGDPIETSAVGSVFGSAGVLIGSVKPNLGHGEGASGLTSIIKCVLALEHKTIPPNIKFHNPNPKIPFDQHKLTVPVVPTPFPQGRAERISVNSFGMGGTNSHAILEAWNPSPANQPLQLGDSQPGIDPSAELLLLSASTEASLAAQFKQFQERVRLSPEETSDIAYTCALRRQHLPYRSFAIVQPNGNLVGVPSTAEAPSRASPVVMVFSGQGAQWLTMGKELILNNQKIRKDLEDMDAVLQRLSHPPTWKLVDQLLAPASTSEIHKASLAQPLCTALQIALSNAYSALGVMPSSVVGHSSGEIAAAYAAGYLTMGDAITIAYYRGFVMKNNKLDGGMVAVGLGAHDVSKFLRKGEVVLACENSPSSSTISGDRETLIEVLAKIQKDQPDILARPLKVDMAYHSHHMTPLSKEYIQLLEEAGIPKPHLQRRVTAKLFSSVTAELVAEDANLGAKYWSQNLTSPVRFSSAVTCLLSDLSSTTTPSLLEIGPHSTLAGPLRQILSSLAMACEYVPSLTRGNDGQESFLSSIGRLFQLNYPLKLNSMFPTGRSVAGLPPYPWDHSSTALWSESRISRAWRHRSYANHCLLGNRIPESSSTEPVWRHILRLEDEPWLADHKIQSDVVFPFAAYASMVGEAVRQLTGGAQGMGYQVRRPTVYAAMLVPIEAELEVVTSLKRHMLSDEVESEWWEFSIASLSGNVWTRHCDGQAKPTKNDERPRTPGWQAMEQLPRSFPKLRRYNAMAKAGYNFGPAFRWLEAVRTSTAGETARGTIPLPVVRDVGTSATAFTLHPTAIDACLQLFLSAKSQGLSRRMIDLSLPVAIEHLEINDPMGSPLEGKAWNEFGRAERSAIECQANGQVVLRAEGIQMRRIDGRPANPADDDDVHAAARLHWMPHFDFVDHAQLFISPRIDEEQIRLLEELQLLIILESAPRLQQLEPCQPHFAKFRSWLNKQIALAELGTYELVPHPRDLCRLTSGERLNLIHTLSARLEGLPHPAMATGIKRVFDNIEGIFTGSVDTLETLMHDKLLARIYDVASFDYSPFIRTLSHSRPQLRILEVGAGTGGTTHTILRSLDHDAALPSYSCYTFTDISAGFFPAAQERFSYAQNLEFKVLDISRDPKEQGFEPETYDLVLAANVVHATPCLRETLRNLAWLLKPEGMLVMTEVCSTTRTSTFIFGNFIGWWLGESDGRIDGPCVGVERWDRELKSSGFRGVDTVRYDADAPEYQKICVIRSGKDVEPVQEPQRKVSFLTSAPDSALLGSLKDAFAQEGWIISTCGLSESPPDADTDIISLLDLEMSLFAEVTADTLASFQRTIQGIQPRQNMLWLIPPVQITCKNPHAAASLAIARTVRSELALSFATLEIEPSDPCLSSHILHVLRKLRTAQDTNTLESDKEFAIHNGLIQIGRYRPFFLVDETTRLGIQAADTIPGAETAAVLNVTQPGVLDSLTWERRPLPAFVPAGHVEVTVHNAGINFRDVVFAGGIIAWSGPGSLPLTMEVAGVVSRLGAGVDGLQVGDRVMAMSCTGGFATKVITDCVHVMRIPDRMSFKQAATMQAVYSTVISALLDTGHLSKGMSVLIHSACGGVGLAALQICRMVGNVVVYCTVGNDKKAQYLVEKYGIPRDRIFRSRDAKFLDGVMNATNGEGVDLVLNSLAGELLHASWKCVARGGKLLELGKRDLTGGGKLDMSLFLDHRSYCGIDIAYMADNQPRIMRDYCERMLLYYEQGLIAPIEPIIEFEALDAKHAFRHLRAGEHIGKLVLNIPQQAAALNPVPVRRPMSFRADAAYLLVGGASGLGRSLAIWLVERGAKSLVFLSRKAGTSKESKELAQELESMGACAVMVSGSVSRAEDVDKAIAAAPAPIKGAFQLAMVQRDSPFLSISHEDWTAAVEPKVTGTWNLHNALLKTPLDFFWLASSTMTVVDQPGQANYKAGCMFLEAFCRYRHSLSLPASVLSICPIEDVGYVADNAYAKRSVMAQGNYMLGEREFLDCVEASLFEQRPPSSEQPITAGHIQEWQSRGHIVMGMRSSSQLHLADDRNPTNWRRDPRMGFYHNRSLRPNSSNESESSSLKRFMDRLAESGATAAEMLGDEANVEFLATETGRKVMDFLLKPGASVDLSLGLAQMGMDSLAAIELRRWFRQAMGLQVTVLELMGSNSMKELGGMVAEKLREKHVEAF